LGEKGRKSIIRRMKRDSPTGHRRTNMGKQPDDPSTKGEAGQGPVGRGHFIKRVSPKVVWKKKEGGDFLD